MIYFIFVFKFINFINFIIKIFNLKTIEIKIFILKIGHSTWSTPPDKETAIFTRLFYDN